MDGAEALFQEIVAGGYPRVKRFVTEKQEEYWLLDFKQKKDRQNGVPADEDKRTYSKALSGFANSDGGVLVWGVKAAPTSPDEPDVATELKPIKGHRTFLTHLNSLASQLVARSVDGVRNEVIDDPADPARGFVISLIPASDAAPHRAEASGVKRYYKRNVSSFIQMEHFDLEDMFGRRKRPLLGASCRFGASRLSGGVVRRVRAELVIENDGRHLAQHVGLRFTVQPSGTISPGARWARVGDSVLALDSAHVIHPTTHMTAAIFEIGVEQPRELPGPFQLAGDLFAADSPPRSFALSFRREVIQAAMPKGGKMPDWAWQEPGEG